jgi:hypothetical protein
MNLGYRIRVLALNDQPVEIAKLKSVLPANQELIDESDDSQGWTQLLLKHVAGPEIAVIERDPVVPGQLGAEELKEFLENIQGEKPDSAVKWLTSFLPRVKVIFALQLLSGTEVGEGWSGVHAIQYKLWSQLGGILQSDGEGLTNEDGYHILWQFDGDPRGSWKMAVLGNDGNWTAFEMRLEDKNHRTAFLEGLVPSGVKVLSKSEP